MKEAADLASSSIVNETFIDQKVANLIYGCIGYFSALGQLCFVRDSF